MGVGAFLTDEFAQIVWLLDLSFLGAIVVNAIYLGYDPPWFKSASQIALSFISMAVAIRTFQVLPFRLQRVPVQLGTAGAIRDRSHDGGCGDLNRRRNGQTGEERR